MTNEISKLLPLFLAENGVPPQGTFELCVVESAIFDAIPIFAQNCIGEDDPGEVARYIVTACNSHQALVDVVEELLCELADKCCVSVDELCEECGIGRDAKAALALAKGETT